MLHIELDFIAQKAAHSRPIYLVDEHSVADLCQSGQYAQWMKAHTFTGQAGEVLLIPNAEGGVDHALLGLGPEHARKHADIRFLSGKLVSVLPEGAWHFLGMCHDPVDLGLGLCLASYRFSRYKSVLSRKKLSFFLECDRAELQRLYDAISLTRNLINTPANDMGPDGLETAVRTLAKTYGATVSVVCGDALLTENFPLIHAVGRASSTAPRLIELRWGHNHHPKITLVGKGVAFDTGGLDIKSASGMLLMKKDMGGAANVLGLGHLIMDAKLPLQLRILIPAVENAIAGNAFRPSDIVSSRKGLQIEIGNTDAEGRLVLADALAYGDEESPHLMIDMATLTGAARVALGPDLPPFYCDDAALVEKVIAASVRVGDPVWHMPLWQPYQKKLMSPIADLNNVSADGFAGSIVAALFLQKFVEKAQCWAHFDIYGWAASEKLGAPIGGEAQAIRALYDVLKAL